MYKITMLKTRNVPYDYLPTRYHDVITFSAGEVLTFDNPPTDKDDYTIAKAGVTVYYFPYDSVIVEKV